MPLARAAPSGRRRAQAAALVLVTLALMVRLRATRTPSPDARYGHPVLRSLGCRLRQPERLRLAILAAHGGIRRLPGHGSPEASVLSRTGFSLSSIKTGLSLSYSDAGGPGLPVPRSPALLTSEGRMPRAQSASSERRARMPEANVRRAGVQAAPGRVGRVESLSYRPAKRGWRFHFRPYCFSSPSIQRPNDSENSCCATMPVRRGSLRDSTNWSRSSEAGGSRFTSRMQ
jgi:hypothetical protein